MHPGTLRGALMLVAAMACFSLSDSFAKQLSAGVSLVVLAWLRYVMLLATALPAAILQPRHLKTSRPLLQLARAAGLVASAILFLHALRVLPVAEATAMVFASPLFVTLLSVLVLREHVPPVRWLPVALGFAGVLVVARPGGAAFGAAAAFPILSSMAWAAAVVCTRKLSASDSSTTTMLYSSLAGSIGLGLLLPELEISWLANAGHLVAMAIAWCLAQWLTIWAYRSAPAAAIAPFAYSQLVWAAGLGLVLFGHVPDGWSLAGMGLILGSGLVAAWMAGRPVAGPGGRTLP